jgi:hypothetical protein
MNTGFDRYLPTGLIWRMSVFIASAMRPGMTPERDCFAVLAMTEEKDGNRSRRLRA